MESPLCENGFYGGVPDILNQKPGEKTWRVQVEKQKAFTAKDAKGAKQKNQKDGTARSDCSPQKHRNWCRLSLRPLRSQRSLRFNLLVFGFTLRP